MPPGCVGCNIGWWRGVSWPAVRIRAGMNISFGPSVIDGRFREHLQLLILKDQASVHYELSGDGDELAIDLAEDGVFSIRRRQHKPALAIEYLQPQGQPVTLTVASDDHERVYVAESFWHLYLAEPELVQTELIPYLEILRPSWQLAATAAAVEDALIQHARHPHEVDTERWRTLVAQLGSDSFSERESSERELYRVGQLILPFLEELDPQSLDAEQADRVGKLIKALSVDYEDATDRVANWLAGDRNAVALAARSRRDHQAAIGRPAVETTGRHLDRFRSRSRC